MDMPIFLRSKRAVNTLSVGGGWSRGFKSRQKLAGIHAPLGVWQGINEIGTVWIGGFERFRLSIPAGSAAGCPLPGDPRVIFDSQEVGSIGGTPAVGVLYEGVRTEPRLPSRGR
jgi:hypothetical protein